MEFIKMHGLGNDFVVIDTRKQSAKISPSFIKEIANRRLGVGCDQVIVLSHPTDKYADIHMDIYNQDSTQVGACGNATRCVSGYLIESNGTKSVVVETAERLLKCRLLSNGYISVDMGIVSTEWAQIPLSRPVDTFHLPMKYSPTAVNLGNPHCVFFDVSADKIDCAAVEVDPLFPERTNVEIVEVKSRTHIRIKVHERGAGPTPASGSCACGAYAAAVMRGLVEKEGVVEMDGGCLANSFQR